MAARRSRTPTTPEVSSAQLQALGPLGLIVSCLQPHARAFLREAVAMSVAASVGKRDHRLMFGAVEKAFAEIKVAGEAEDHEAESQAWLRRQLEGLDGRRAVMAARETGAIDDLCDRLRSVLVELDQWNPTIYQLTAEFLGRRIDLWREDARHARRQALRVLDGGRA